MTVPYSFFHCLARDAVGTQAECGFSVLLVGTNCSGAYDLFKATCLAGEVHADPLMHPYPCGTCADVTGVPAMCWTFMGWLGDARGTEPTVRITMTQDKCVEAVFGTPVSLGPYSNGLARVEPVVPLYPCGAKVRAWAKPNDGYYFDHWTNSLTGAASSITPWPAITPS